MNALTTPPTLTADLIESFAALYLSHRYDNPRPVPEFHRECWTIYSDPMVLAAAVAAPRGHAKSTALTHVFIIAAAVFRFDKFILLLGSTEDLAKEALSDIADEFRDNTELRSDFGLKRLVVDQDGDVIVECIDGYQFRVLARGAGQKIRGIKWHGQRPGLMVGDDIEDDEMVRSRERREEFKRWFLRAARQALRGRGKIRVHGTILHDDSLLAGLIRNRSWAGRLYKAHAAFDDFSHPLWPDMFDEAWLRAKRQEFLDAVDAEGYAQEYLNDPRDRSDAYLRKEWFVPMQEEDYSSTKIRAVGVDLAISKADRANRTSFTVGGKDLDNVLHVLDQRCGRWDSTEIIDAFFDIQQFHQPEVFFVEDGVIWKAIKPVLDEQMRTRNAFINIVAIWPVKDKAARGRSLQRRMRSGSVRFDTSASWYAEMEDELLRFTGTSEATLDDQFDSSAILSRGFEGWNVDSEDMQTDEEIAFERESNLARAGGFGGRSSITGY